MPWACLLGCLRRERGALRGELRLLTGLREAVTALGLCGRGQLGRTLGGELLLGLREP